MNRMHLLMVVCFSNSDINETESDCFSIFYSHSCIGSNLEYSFTNNTNKTSVSLATTTTSSSAKDACNTILVSTSSWLQSNKYSQTSLLILHVCDVSVIRSNSYIPLMIEKKSLFSLRYESISPFRCFGI